MSEESKAELPKEHKSYDEIAKGIVDIVESGGDINEAKEFGKKIEFENRKLITDIDKSGLEEN